MRRFSIPLTGHQSELLGSDLVRQAERPAYWVSDHCYELNGELVERQLLPATQQLWDMYLDFAADAVMSDTILASLGLPEQVWDAIQASWKRRDPLTVARFDLAYDGTSPPKLHECNADVVGHVYEAAMFQVQWLKDRQPLLRPSARQLDGLQEALGHSLVAASGGRPIELLHVGHDPYDRLMLHTIEQALLACRHDYSFHALAELSELELLHSEGGFYMKDFRWDHLIFDPERVAMLDRLAPCMTSPLWSVVLESKGSLPWLWSRHRGHPNLLPAWFASEHPDPDERWAEKSLFSIRGKGVSLNTGGDGAGKKSVIGAGICQQLHLLPRFGTSVSACWASTGVFIVDGKPVALSMTESDDPLIGENTDRTVPHILI